MKGLGWASSKSICPRDHTLKYSQLCHTACYLPPLQFPLRNNLAYWEHLYLFIQQLVFLVVILCRERYAYLPVKDRTSWRSAVLTIVLTTESHSNFLPRHTNSPRLDSTPPRQIFPSLNTHLLFSPVQLPSPHHPLSCRCVVLVPKFTPLNVWFLCGFLCRKYTSPQPCCLHLCHCVFIYVSTTSDGLHRNPLLYTSVPYQFSCSQKLFKFVGGASGWGTESYSALFWYL